MNRRPKCDGKRPRKGLNTKRASNKTSNDGERCEIQEEEDDVKRQREAHVNGRQADGSSRKGAGGSCRPP